MVRPNDGPKMTFDVVIQAANLLLRESSLDPPAAISGILFTERRDVTLHRERHTLN